jgi:hypothetical protein
MPVIKVLSPVPVFVTPSGLRVSVHVPVVGKPFNTTLPVETLQLGCVTVPTEGVLGTVGAAISTIGCDGEEVQPAAFLTVYV